MVKFIITMIVLIFSTSAYGATALMVVVNMIEDGKKPFLVVNKKDSTLSLYSNDKALIKTYPISLGTDPRDYTLGDLIASPKVPATPVGVYKTYSGYRPAYGLILNFPETAVNGTSVAIHTYGKEGDNDAATKKPSTQGCAVISKMDIQDLQHRIYKLYKLEFFTDYDTYFINTYILPGGEMSVEEALSPSTFSQQGVRFKKRPWWMDTKAVIREYYRTFR